jgi:hypothetical protein
VAPTFARVAINASFAANSRVISGACIGAVFTPRPLATAVPACFAHFENGRFYSVKNSKNSFWSLMPGMGLWR